MNKLSKIETDSQIESRMTAKGGRRTECGGLSKKEKGLMDTDCSVVIAGVRRYKGSKSAVPNLLGTRDQFFQGQGWGVVGAETGGGSQETFPHSQFLMDRAGTGPWPGGWGPLD